MIIARTGGCGRFRLSLARTSTLRVNPKALPAEAGGKLSSFVQNFLIRLPKDSEYENIASTHLRVHYHAHLL